MSTTAQRRRHLERVEHLCAATLRAFTDRPGLRFKGGVLHDESGAVQAAAPHLRTDADSDYSSARGAADGLALRLVHSDPVLHASLRNALDPDSDVAALVFELLEQFRTEALAGPAHRGMTANLRHRHETWSAEFQTSGLLETMEGLLLYTVAQVARSKVTNQPVVAATEDRLEATRFGLAPVIGADLAQLRRLRSRQAAYAEPALRIATAVAGLLADEVGRDSASTASSTSRALRRQFALLLGEQTRLDRPEDADGRGGWLPRREQSEAYSVYTRRYDLERTMTQLCRPAQLVRLRERLDELVGLAQVNVRPLARALRAACASPAPNGWLFGQDEGLIDSGRLSRLVTSTGDARVFRLPDQEDRVAAQVTVLLDCSGSMRRHQERLATLIDLLVRTLDLAGIDSEVLGYTTAAWNGGRAMQDWRSHGRPARPGRLNERLHLVLKTPDQTWRHSRRSLAGLLRSDYYREALDGEAVEWAAARLSELPDLEHRVLLVVSDGSPMDSATAIVHGPDYLDQHLSAVVDRLEHDGAVHTLGLGVGLDLSAFYPRRHVIDVDHDERTQLREIVGALVGVLARR